MNVSSHQHEATALISSHRLQHQDHHQQSYQPSENDVDKSFLNSALSSSNRKNLSFYYQNVGGLRSRLDIVYASLAAFSYDIIVLTETWLSNNILSTEVFSNSYTVFRKDRCKEKTGMDRGGGVLVAIRSSLSCREICLESNSSFCDQDIDQVIVNVNLNEYEIFILASYIPPRSSLEVYNLHLSNLS